MGKFCSTCGKEINENAVVCLGCGAAVDGKYEAAVGGGPAQTANQPPSSPHQRDVTKTNAMAITGFVLGCVSLLLSFWGIVGILALVFSVIGLAQINNYGGRGKGLATTGLILGILGVVWGVIVIMLI